MRAPRAAPARARHLPVRAALGRRRHVPRTALLPPPYPPPSPTLPSPACGEGLGRGVGEGREGALIARPARAATMRPMTMTASAAAPSARTPNGGTIRYAW